MSGKWSELLGETGAATAVDEGEVVESTTNMV
jgi:hypothetical protein